MISAAEIANVDAIHPGYGFLAENSEFLRFWIDLSARNCIESGHNPAPSGGCHACALFGRETARGDAPPQFAQTILASFRQCGGLAVCRADADGTRL